MDVIMENEALQLIEEQLKKHENPVVACSFGKDSLAVLHLVKRVADKLNKQFQVLWNNTGLSYPSAGIGLSVIEVKDKLEKEWNLEIIETKAKKTIWEIVKNNNFPGIVSSQRDKDQGGTNCCRYLKKKPTEESIKNNNWDLYFDGLTAYESDQRYISIKKWGIKHYHKTFKIQKVHPIAFWGVNNVWDYIEKYNIPYPDIYDAEIEDYTKRGYSEQICGHRVDRAIRNGCWACTLPIKNNPEKLKQLRKYYPKHWKVLMKKGLAKEIAGLKLGIEDHEQGTFDFDGAGNWLDDDTLEDWLEQRPCFFDQI